MAFPSYDAVNRLTPEQCVDNAVYWERLARERNLPGDKDLADLWLEHALKQEAKFRRMGRILAFGFDPEL